MPVTVLNLQRFAAKNTLSPRLLCSALPENSRDERVVLASYFTFGTCRTTLVTEVDYGAHSGSNGWCSTEHVAVNVQLAPAPIRDPADACWYLAMPQICGISSGAAIRAWG